MVVSVLFVCFTISFYLIGKRHLAGTSDLTGYCGRVINTGATVLDNWVLSESEMRNNLPAIKANRFFRLEYDECMYSFIHFNNNYQWLMVPFLFFLISYLCISKHCPKTSHDKNDHKEQKQRNLIFSDMYQLCKNGGVLMLYVAVFPFIFNDRRQ